LTGFSSALRKIAFSVQLNQIEKLTQNG